MIKLSNGGTLNNLVTDYYFRDLMRDSKLYSCKWSVNEFMQSNELIRYAHSKVVNFPDFYPPKEPLIKNIKAVFRLGPSGAAASISNYPLKSVNDILDNYCSKNYLDFSCGWGVRLTSAMVKNKNYFGLDPNYKLVDKLQEMEKDYKSVVQTSSTVQILPQGSEVFESKWEGTMDLAFSSPPYFNLEEYKVGDQSINNRTYEQWLEEYWRPTVKNIKKYLKDDGIMMLNIKNFNKMNLLDNMKRISIQEGFFYHYSIDLKNITRTMLINSGKSSNEEILLFTKHKEFKGIESPNESLDEW